MVYATTAGRLDSATQWYYTKDASGTGMLYSPVSSYDSLVISSLQLCCIIEVCCMANCWQASWCLRVGLVKACFYDRDAVLSGKQFTRCMHCAALMRLAACWCLVQVDIRNITWELLPVHYRS